MSILGKIMGGIFKKKEQEPASAPVVTAPPASSATVGTDQPAPSVPVAGAPAHEREGAEIVDVAGILDLMNDQRDQKLNWRTSIVDLMKLLGFESSLAERKALADELGYTGDKNDSAAMNIWLHNQVIQKIRDNGGQLPTDL